MSVDPAKPGLIDSLTGAGGEAWRVVVTICCCVLVVLLITGASAAVRHWGGL